MATILRRLEMWRSSEVFGQLVRFALAGFASTLVYAAVYLPLTSWVLPRHLAVLAVPPAFLVAVTFGFFAHSMWSFRGHGTRDPSGRQHMKFVLVQCSGLLLNAFFTFLVTGVFGLAAWIALIPVVLVTPIVTFLFNRIWVFA